MDQPHPQLDYLSDRENPAPRTRVTVQPYEHGLRIVDPPLAADRRTRRCLLIQCATNAAIAFALGIIFTILTGAPRYMGAIAVAALVLYNVQGVLRYWRHSSRHPTVLDIVPRSLIVTLPTRRRIIIPLGELSIRASRPQRIIGVSGRISSLVVSGEGRQLHILLCRQYAEVRWLARLLRTSTGHAVDHASEPPILPLDTQDSAAPEKPWSGPLPPVPLAGEIAAAGKSKSFGQWLSHEYNDLGCAAFLLLSISAITGLFVVSEVAAAVVICTQFGPNAYFQDHVRFVPHRAFQLNNGKALRPEYKALHVVLSFLLETAWVGVSLLASIAVNRIAQWRNKRIILQNQRRPRL